MAEIKLKPCPFCGSKAFLSDNSSCSYVCCGGCGATGQSFKVSKKYSSDEKAAEAWNKRTDNEYEASAVIAGKIGKIKDDEIPAADVVKVVKCKDCRYYRKIYKLCSYRSDKCNVYSNDNDFCSYGERKESYNGKD